LRWKYNSNERSFYEANPKIAQPHWSVMATIPDSATPSYAAGQDTRFDRRFSEILDYATEVFAEKGYEGASMRDLSRLSGMSLAGLYYYFDSKEKLLYLIQKHTFTTIINRLRGRLSANKNPEERIRIFVQNHVEYALAKQKAMKVLSHEDDVLKNGHGAELAAIKREYYKICVGLVDELAKAERLPRLGQSTAAKAGVSTRTAVMGLFGMMNWLYTWYKPRIDPDAEELSRQISDIFLRGVRGRDGLELRTAQFGGGSDARSVASPAKQPRRKTGNS
jgi:TetR/AcrR family transcriptional regulator, cholesterol catabolism regulator